MILFFYCPYEKARKLNGDQAAPTVCSVLNTSYVSQYSHLSHIYSLCATPPNSHSIPPPPPPPPLILTPIHHNPRLILMPLSHPIRLIRTFNNFPFRCVGFGPSASSPCCVHFTFHFCSRFVWWCRRPSPATALLSLIIAMDITSLCAPTTHTDTSTHLHNITIKKERVSADRGYIQIHIHTHVRGGQPPSLQLLT